ncbi:unnamed protein product (macronuclear) [Paramecium tetraurelia]|uniref:Uncharacterized protein n=1 Tax=Paramecium tetraurelia TaxID=5888 RepID=A0CC69_PARTE|nr:uncharacterized protein GSPATT00037170001 [Paramecium tetraurelia]CAK68386.1 unnamed protein product [Paramecium tetraurelia]|eukprot:XP_001435783.1 hypothetical protein (macronuclear) [Paramecium tetraurelia strain d4-2]
MLNVNSKRRMTLFSSRQSIVHGTGQNVLLWDQMFGNFQSTLKQKNQINKSQKNGNDPIFYSSPLNQPNPIQFNEKLRQGFRQYLNGELSALNLVNECNHLNRKETKLKNRFKLVKRANMFANQLQVTNKYRSLHQQGLTDQEIEKKVKVLQRFEKIKKLIQKNQETKLIEDTNLKDVQLFRQLYEVSENNKSKFKQKDLITERTDGQREYENVNYFTHRYLRVKRDDEQLKKNKESKNDQDFFNKQKVRDIIDQKLRGFIDEREQQEQKLLSKAKRRMLMKNTQFKEYEQEKYVLNDPLNKDVKLYAYLFVKPKEKMQFNEINQKTLPLTKRVKESKHYFKNFKKQLTSRSASMTNDSSLNSILEINIDNLYKASDQIQSQILSNDQEKICKKNQVIIESTITQLRNSKDESNKTFF